MLTTGEVRQKVIRTKRGSLGIEACLGERNLELRGCVRVNFAIQLNLNKFRCGPCHVISPTLSLSVLVVERLQTARDSDQGFKDS